MNLMTGTPTAVLLFLMLAGVIGLGVVVQTIRRALLDTQRRLAILGVGTIALVVWVASSFAMAFLTLVTAFGVAHLRPQSTGLFPEGWQIYGLLGLYAAFGTGLVIAIGRVPPEHAV
jgi:hypothetical protein